MTTPEAVLDIPAAGVRIEIRKTAAETGGELLEFDVVGRARGLFAAGAPAHRARPSATR